MAIMPISAQASESGLSIFRDSFMSSSRMYASFACPVRQQDCVLPLPDARPAPAPAPAPQPAPPTVSAPVAQVEEGGGFPLIPVLLAGAAAVIAAFVLLDGDDDEELPTSP